MQTITQLHSERTKERGDAMRRFWFGSPLIASAGYNAQCELLEVEFVQNGKILQYANVPEEIWYQFRQERCPEAFFHKYIKGFYREKLMPKKQSKVTDEDKKG